MFVIIYVVLPKLSSCHGSCCFGPHSLSPGPGKKSRTLRNRLSCGIHDELEFGKYGGVEVLFCFVCGVVFGDVKLVRRFEGQHIKFIDRALVSHAFNFCPGVFCHCTTHQISSYLRVLRFHSNSHSLSIRRTRRSALAISALIMLESLQHSMAERSSLVISSPPSMMLFVIASISISL